MRGPPPMLTQPIPAGPPPMLTQPIPVAENFDPEPMEDVEAHTSGRKRRPKTTLRPAPIEEVTEFNIEQYIKDLSCEMSVGQAAKAVPTYRRGLQRMLRKTREANYIGREIPIK